MGGKCSKLEAPGVPTKKPVAFQKTKEMLAKIEAENSRKGQLHGRTVTTGNFGKVPNYGAAQKMARDTVTPADLRGSHDDPNYQMSESLHDTYAGTQGAA